MGWLLGVLVDACAAYKQELRRAVVASPVCNWPARTDCNLHCAFQPGEVQVSCPNFALQGEIRSLSLVDFYSVAVQKVPEARQCKKRWQLPASLHTWKGPFSESRPSGTRSHLLDSIQVLAVVVDDGVKAPLHLATHVGGRAPHNLDTN
jgi:hypothetical protein